MSYAFQYLKEHLKLIFMQGLFVCVFAVVFYFYHLPLAAVLYPTAICFLFGILFTCQSFYQAYEKHKRLREIQNLYESGEQGTGLKNAWMESTLAGEFFVRNAKAQDEDYFRIIGKLCSEMQALENKMTASYREMIDYFTVWVHQVKTPIASMKLHLEGEDTRVSRRLTSDLLHIEQYVGMVLTFLEMGDATTDYVFRSVGLDQILRENIRKLRGDFIMKKLNLIYIPTEKTVVSDEKWLSFVIEQLLSNALKYTNEGQVTIEMKTPETLCISDTGIGIAPEDMPRIFEKGYTGGNGRRDKRASGLGLYLCKQVCDKLGVGINIVSEVEAGTTVMLEFKSNVTKM